MCFFSPCRHFVFLNHLYFFFFIDAPLLTSSFSTTMNIIESHKPFALTCSSTADPAPSITWRKDGVMQTRNITTQINKTSPGNTVNVLSRLEFNRGVKRADHGRYRCNASNYLGSQIKEVNLQVWCKYRIYESIHIFLTRPLLTIGIFFEIFNVEKTWKEVLQIIYLSIFLLFKKCYELGKTIICRGPILTKTTGEKWTLFFHSQVKPRGPLRKSAHQSVSKIISLLFFS